MTEPKAAPKSYSGQMVQLERRKMVDSGERTSQLERPEDRIEDEGKRKVESEDGPENGVVHEVKTDPESSQARESISLNMGPSFVGQHYSTHPLLPGPWKTKVTCAGKSVFVEDGWREPYVEALIKLGLSRSESGEIIASLTLDQVALGINNCCSRRCSSPNGPCDGKKCSPLCVTAMHFRFSPGSWAAKGQCVGLDPPTISKSFDVQRSFNRSVQVAIDLRRASISHQSGIAISCNASSHEWAAASRDAASNWFSFTWNQLKWEDGTDIQFSKSRLFWQPQLAIPPSFMQMNSGSFKAGVSWEFPQEIVQLPELDFKLEVILDTVFINRKRLFSKVGSTSVRRGPKYSYEKLLAFQ